MTPLDDEKLTKMLREAAEECKRLGYRPTAFLKMLNADGGYATAVKLLASQKISDGFVELQMLGKLNLTVEALVLENGWAEDFEPDLIRQAQRRLVAAGYIPKIATGDTRSAPVTATKGDVRSVIPEKVSETGLSDGLKRVLLGYPSAAKETFSKHSLANFIRGSLADHVAALVQGHAPSLEVKGSAGQGVWAKGPWVGIFDPLITTSAQSGYYVCYLFKEDMSGVYLSLNQGMTEAKRHYKADAKTALTARAQNFRAMLGSRILSDLVFDIDLAPSAPSNDTAFYEAGNICAVYYSVESMPGEAELGRDLARMISLYSDLIEVDLTADSALDHEGDLPVSMLEDGTKFRLHKRIERNARLVKLVKQSKPSSCQVCGVDFGKRYGPLGAGYIEAHHLRPMSSLKGTKAELDPIRDFAVLCSNCHRMVHRSGLIDDLERFKKEHYRGE